MKSTLAADSLCAGRVSNPMIARFETLFPRARLADDAERLGPPAQREAHVRDRLPRRRPTFGKRTVRPANIEQFFPSRGVPHALAQLAGR